MNNFLMWLGIIDQPLQDTAHDLAIYIGIVYAYLRSWCCRFTPTCEA